MLPFDVVGVAEVVALVLLVHVEEDDHSGYEVNHLAGGKKMKIGSAVASPVPVTDTILQELDHCNYLSALKILILIHSLITKLNKKKDTPIRSSVWTPAPCSSWRRCTSPWRRWGRRRWPVGRGGRTWPFRPLRSRRHPAPWNHTHTHTHTWTKYSTISSQWRPPGGAESASPIRRPGPQKNKQKAKSPHINLNWIWYAIGWLRMSSEWRPPGGAASAPPSPSTLTHPFPSQFMDGKSINQLHNQFDTGGGDRSWSSSGGGQVALPPEPLRSQYVPRVNTPIKFETRKDQSNRHQFDPSFNDERQPTAHANWMQMRLKTNE